MLMRVSRFEAALRKRGAGKGFRPDARSVRHSSDGRRLLGAADGRETAAADYVV
jgi:hypothetical protein